MIFSGVLSLTSRGIVSAIGARQSGASIFAQALAQLQLRGDTLWIPGVGMVNGFMAGNYVDSAGVTPAAVNDVVGRVAGATGGINLTQATTANKPFLRQTGGVYRWEFDATDSLTTTFSAGYGSCTVVDAAPGGQVTLAGQNLVGAYSIYGGLTVAELSPDPEFDNPAKWAISAGWAISGGAANATSATSGTSAGILTADRISVSTGDLYQYEFVVDSLTAGGFAAVGSLIGTGPTANTTGKFGGTLVATSTGLSSFAVRAVGVTTGAVSRLSLRKLLSSTHGRIIIRNVLTAPELALYQQLANKLAGL